MIRYPLHGIMADIVCQMLGFQSPQTAALLSAFYGRMTSEFRVACQVALRGGAA